jgi:hypothetical protein
MVKFIYGALILSTLFTSPALAAYLSAVNIYDGAGNSLTSQVSGSQRALDVGINVGGAQIDPRTRNWSLLNSTDSVNAVQSGTWTLGRTWTLGAGDSVAVSNFPSTQAVTGTFFQSIQPVSGSVSISNFPSSQPISGSVTVSNFPSTQAVTGTFFQATQPVSGTVGISGTVAVSAASLPLPSGAATAALQSQVSAQLPTTLGAQTTANSLAVNIASDQTLSVTAKQFPNANGSFSQAAISSVASATAPANAVAFVLMADDANTANMNYVVGGTASATNGMQLEPGRDTGPIFVATTISICPASGTQTYRLQWILTQ